MEILEYESILTVLLHIGMDLIDREDVGKGETIQLYILVKDFKHVGIRSLNLLAMETAESSRFLNASTISISEALVVRRLWLTKRKVSFVT